MDNEQNYRINTITVFFIVSYILLWVIVLFGFWGGNPEGVLVKFKNGKKEIDSQIMDLKNRVNQMEFYIEILRSQLSLLKP